jgi:hypothetical protein
MGAVEGAHAALPSTQSLSEARARARRDRTVPSSTWSVSAICS